MAEEALRLEAVGSQRQVLAVPLQRAEREVGDGRGRQPLPELLRRQFGIGVNFNGMLVVVRQEMQTAPRQRFRADTRLRQATAGEPETSDT